MLLTGDDVKVRVGQRSRHVELVLLSALGEAHALLTPDQALAIASELTEQAESVAENPGGTLN